MSIIGCEAQTQVVAYQVLFINKADLDSLLVAGTLQYAIHINAGDMDVLCCKCPNVNHFLNLNRTQWDSSQW